MAKGYVLDSFALIGYLENEPFAEEMEVVLRHAGRGDIRLYVHVIHLGEVYYITHREKGKDVADLAYTRIKGFPLNFVDRISEALLLTASILKARFPISYADAFAAAMAKINRVPLLSGDPEFLSLQEKGELDMAWLRSTPPFIEE
ncbi:MAG: PIN domain-containing protein [Deltaproteobacteria bacterium]|nr:PIN domain-containing protein [Deltaproteobacteria bacterium]